MIIVYLLRNKSGRAHLVLYPCVRSGCRWAHLESYSCVRSRRSFTEHAGYSMRYSTFMLLRVVRSSSGSSNAGWRMCQRQQWSIFSGCHLNACCIFIENSSLGHRLNKSFDRSCITATSHPRFRWFRWPSPTRGGVEQNNVIASCRV